MQYPNLRESLGDYVVQNNLMTLIIHSSTVFFPICNVALLICLDALNPTVAPALVGHTR